MVTSISLPAPSKASPVTTSAPSSVQARNDPSTAPLAIYLAGGPGEASSYSAVSSENGPCYVDPNGKSTTNNTWSFNNYVNKLYIDQPVQTGFSYDQLANGSYDVNSGVVTPLDSEQLASAHTNTTIGVGTFASQTYLGTTKSTVTSVKALWHFAETWLTSFPEYNTTSEKISVWGNSVRPVTLRCLVSSNTRQYGGFWVPAIVSSFQKQLASTTISSHLHGLTMDTLGITNGCVDLLYQGTAYSEFLHNNTCGLQLISETQYKETLLNFTKPGGSRDLILECRELGRLGDPESIGDNQTVNEACNLATDYLEEYVTVQINVSSLVALQ